MREVTRHSGLIRRPLQAQRPHRLLADRLDSAMHAGEPPAAHDSTTAGCWTSSHRCRCGDEYGRARYYLDLADPASARRCRVRRIVAPRPRPPAPDRHRHNWLETAGWRMRYFTDRDLYSRPSEIIRILRAA